MARRQCVDERLQPTPPPKRRLKGRTFTSSLAENPQDYHLYFDAEWRSDLATMVLRDRNSPSVLLWSVGNEIGMRGSPAGATLCAQVQSRIRVAQLA